MCLKQQNGWTLCWGDQLHAPQNHLAQMMHKAEYRPWSGVQSVNQIMSTWNNDVSAISPLIYVFWEILI